MTPILVKVSRTSTRLLPCRTDRSKRVPPLYSRMSSRKENRALATWLLRGDCGSLFVDGHQECHCPERGEILLNQSHWKAPRLNRTIRILPYMTRILTRPETLWTLVRSSETDSDESVQTSECGWV